MCGGFSTELHALAIWGSQDILEAISGMPKWAVGTREEMARFEAAFVKCMEKPSEPADAAARVHVPALNPSELDRGSAVFG